MQAIGTGFKERPGTVTEATLKLEAATHSVKRTSSEAEDRAVHSKFIVSVVS